MPSTGTLAVKIAGSADGASPSMTDAGPPDRMMPRGANFSRVALSTDWKGWISQYTPASRTRRAINWVTWEPKSTIRRRSAMGGYKGLRPGPQCGSRLPGPRASGPLMPLRRAGGPRSGKTSLLLGRQFPPHQGQVEVAPNIGDLVD